MSGNCDNFNLDDETLIFPSKEDYIIIKNKIFSAYEKWFLIMSLFWRYEF